MFIQQLWAGFLLWACRFQWDYIFMTFMSFLPDPTVLLQDLNAQEDILCLSFQCTHTHTHTHTHTTQNHSAKSVRPHRRCVNACADVWKEALLSAVRGLFSGREGGSSADCLTPKVLLKDGSSVCI